MPVGLVVLYVALLAVYFGGVGFMVGVMFQEERDRKAQLREAAFKQQFRRIYPDLAHWVDR